MTSSLTSNRLRGPMSSELTAGTPLWWRHTPRGGYGYTRLVPAEYVRGARATILIRVQKVDGTWTERYVKPANVELRNE